MHKYAPPFAGRNVNRRLVCNPSSTNRHPPFGNNSHRCWTRQWRRLATTDRNILALRYFENKTAQEIGRALTLNEQTAQKRANRALEKLRKFFTKRGVSSTTAVMAGAISANSVQAAPVALAKSVTAVAIVKGAAASASTLTLIKGASGGGLVRCRRPPAWPGTQRRPLPFNRQDARVSLTILPGAGHEDPAFMATQMLPTFAFLDKTFGR